MANPAVLRLALAGDPDLRAAELPRALDEAIDGVVAAAAARWTTGVLQVADLEVHRPLLDDGRAAVERRRRDTIPEYRRFRGRLTQLRRWAADCRSP